MDKQRQKEGSGLFLGNWEKMQSCSFGKRAKEEQASLGAGGSLWRFEQ